jgi:acetolactate decarboxylase
LVVLGFVLSPCLAAAADDAEGLYQYSTINALLGGLYDGDLTIAELAEHGDTGLGTVNGVDGELIAADGVFYTVRGDGRAYPLESGEKTPFAVVTRFDSDRQAPLPGGLDFSGLNAHLDGLMVGGENYFQAIRIDGTFPRLTVRSEPKQIPPYRPLAEVIKEQQVVFELSDVQGTLIGFRVPDYAAAFNVPGYHFHFLSGDRRRGGHVLDIETDEGTIRIDEIRSVTVALPDVPGFAHMNLAGAREKDLHAVEKQR